MLSQSNRIRTKMLCFLLTLLLYFVQGQNVPVVTTQGLVSGVQEEGYMMYLGIPYAVVDENNPFGDSIPPPQFEGIFEATDDSAICPQVEEFNNTLVGSLDCLHLNVFVPETVVTEPLPVMVWLYGGRFEFGFFGRYLHGPKFLVRHDIILVTINYRLGAYGFMCTEDPRVPGNQALKDQQTALKWVQENIANFGGDPNKVTISGNSAGGMSSDFQILRNHQPKLFHQAILQSGTAFTSNFLVPDTESPMKLAQYFGLDTNDVSTALDFLATVDALAIVDATTNLQLLFRPCMERTFENVEPFLNYNWITNQTVPLARELNVLVGYTEEESLAGVYLSNIDLTNSVINTLNDTFDVDHEDFTDDDVVRDFFYGDEPYEEVFQGTVDFRSDLAFAYPSLRSVDNFLRNDVQKVYLYTFAYTGGRNFVKARENITIGGANHADELGYLFDIEYMDEPTGDDLVVVDAMTAMWANFVKYGDPTPPSSSLPTWYPVTDSLYHYMTIDSTLVPGTRPIHDRHAFWDAFFERNGHLERRFLENGRVDKTFLDQMFPY